MISIYQRKLAGIVLIVLIWLLLSPLIVGTGMPWATASRPRTATPWRSPLLLAPFVLALAVAPLTWLRTDWPLCAAFLISRVPLERLADRVAGGEVIRRPRWAGLFRVVGSELDSRTGNVGLIIDSDPNGRSGFMRQAPGVLEEHSLGPFFNLNFNDRMTGRWWYQNED